MYDRNKDWASFHNSLSTISINPLKGIVPDYSALMPVLSSARLATQMESVMAPFNSRYGDASTVFMKQLEDAGRLAREAAKRIMDAQARVALDSMSTRPWAMDVKSLTRLAIPQPTALRLIEPQAWGSHSERVSAYLLACF